VADMIFAYIKRSPATRVNAPGRNVDANTTCRDAGQARVEIRREHAAGRALIRLGMDINSGT
jgi:hypothetical protein